MAADLLLAAPVGSVEWNRKEKNFSVSLAFFALSSRQKSVGEKFFSMLCRALSRKSIKASSSCFIPLFLVFGCFYPCRAEAPNVFPLFSPSRSGPRVHPSASLRKQQTICVLWRGYHNKVNGRTSRRVKKAKNCHQKLITIKTTG